MGKVHVYGSITPWRPKSGLFISHVKFTILHNINTRLNPTYLLLLRLVPASLHINLGITVLIYDELVDACRKLDKLGLEESKEEIRRKLNNAWAEASIELEAAEQRIRENADNIVELTNRMERTTCMKYNDVNRNQLIAMESIWGTKKNPSTDTTPCIIYTLCSIYSRL